MRGSKLGAEPSGAGRDDGGEARSLDEEAMDLMELTLEVLPLRDCLIDMMVMV